MRTLSWVTLGAVLGLSFCAKQAFGQQGAVCREAKDWYGGSGYGQLYDPSTSIAFEGRVVEIVHFVPATCMANGLLIRVETEQGTTMTVHLAPLWYLDAVNFRIHEGALVTVAGSRVRYATKDIVLASALTMGPRTLYLRDERGFPMWRRAGRMAPPS